MRNDFVSSVKAIRTLGGVDSLYYFCYCNTDLYLSFFKSISEYNELINNDNIQFLLYAGRDNGVIGLKYSFIYDGIRLASVTFKDPLKQKQVDNIYVQLMGESIYSFGLKFTIDKVSDYLNNLFGYEQDYNYMYPSRVDINCFVGGFDFSEISADCFGGFFRSNRINYIETFQNCKRVETLYLGSRSGSFYFKIYDKRKN